MGNMLKQLKLLNKDQDGASVDNFYVLVLFFTMAVLFMAIIVFWNVAYGVSGLWAGSVGLTIRDNTQRGIDTFDFILLMVYIGIHLGILVSSYLLRSHPVMYVASFILMAVLPLVAVPLSNAYEGIIAESVLSAAAAQMPMTNYIISQLPMFETIWSILTIVVLYAFSRYEGLI